MLPARYSRWCQSGFLQTPAAPEAPVVGDRRSAHPWADEFPSYRRIATIIDLRRIKIWRGGECIRKAVIELIRRAKSLVRAEGVGLNGVPLRHGTAEVTIQQRSVNQSSTAADHGFAIGVR